MKTDLQVLEPDISVRPFRRGFFQKGLLSEFAKFCVIGIANTSLNYLVFYLCLVELELPVLVAGALGFSVAIGPAYFLNRAWSFRSDAPLASGLAKYLSINIFTLAVHLLLQWAVITMLNVAAISSQAVGIFVTTFLNFFLVRRFIFEKTF